MDTAQLFELRRTTFDTPQFRGIEFIETQAKSIINNVPGNYLPFNCSNFRSAPDPLVEEAKWPP